MRVDEAQREMRSAFLGGFMGQAVSGLIWLASAALATWGSPRQAVLVLVLGGFFIFPLTQLGLRLGWGRGRLRPENPLGALGFQVAMVLPLSLPLVGAAALYRLEWFYPAFMIALGAHYLPFVFLYGMPMFFPLGIGLAFGGILLGLYGPGTFALGAWITAGVLFAFALLGRALVVREEGRAPSTAPTAGSG
jgi:hypothetical protein